MASKKYQTTLTSGSGLQVRRQSTAETDPNADIKDLIMGMEKSLNDKLDILAGNIQQNSKLIIDLTTQISDLSLKNKELAKSVQELKSKSTKQEEMTKKLQIENKDIKKSQDSTKEEINDLKRAHEELLDDLSLMEMCQKEMVLRFRGVPQTYDEQIQEKLSQEIANWLGVEVEEMLLDIDKIFRIKSERSDTYKGPGDCLFFFNSRLLKDKILHQKGQAKLIIEDRPIKIFKEIPKRILKKRQNYKTVTDALKKNSIRFRWEFPEGITFTYKDRRKTFRSVEELGKFWRKYKKELTGDPTLEREETTQTPQEA
ncbi:glutamic acid-rich protein-like isoform X1 [Podarcis lilfordi]|uniref:Glutamic acid-rich protein-like isoform X1 n=1 Tax=Podarcis lilfordi TaxID=74358 RepID=A0AA35LN99_9SAUR|nr:glutamic acid-rich protein-like isoform X1 [Podarcis lilfordi]